MSRAETILAALAAADLAEEQGDLTRAAELVRQVEAEVARGNRTLIGITPPAPGSRCPTDEQRRPAPNGRYSVAHPGRYSLIVRPVR